MTKDEKNILKKYFDFTDRQILDLFQETIKKVVTVVLSEKEAEKILLKYNKKCSFLSLNHQIKLNYYNLKECVRLRGLKVPNDWFNVTIKDQDVIERIKETKNEEIYKLEACKNLFDTYLFDEDSYQLSYILSSEYLINRVENFYEEIIKKEFSASKQLKKQS